MNDFDWETAEYPCLGTSEESSEMVCFSSYGRGHDVDNSENNSNFWVMDRFKPHIKPKPKKMNKIRKETISRHSLEKLSSEFMSKDRCLPYVFDLHYDIKTEGQLAVKMCRYMELLKMCNEYGYSQKYLSSLPILK